MMVLPETRSEAPGFKLPSAPRMVWRSAYEAAAPRRLPLGGRARDHRAARRPPAARPDLPEHRRPALEPVRAQLPLRPAPPGVGPRGDRAARARAAEDPAPHQSRALRPRAACGARSGNGREARGDP